MDDDLTGDRQAEAGRAEGVLPAGGAETQPADGQMGDVPRHRWVCGVSYDGRDFCGWQKQPPVPGPGAAGAAMLMARRRLTY